MKRSAVIVFYTLLTLSFLGLGARLVQMQVVEGSVYQAKADVNRFRRLTVTAPRGVIFDRAFRQLVSNQPSFSVAVTEADLPEDAAGQQAVFAALADMLHTAPVVTAEPDVLDARPALLPGTLAQLGAVLHVPAAEIQKTVDDARKISPKAPNLVRSDLDATTAAAIAAHAADWPGIQVMNELQYTFITRKEQPFSPVTIKRNIPFETMQEIEQDHLELPGVSVLPEPVRQYSLGSYMSHILGYMGAIPPDTYAASLPPEGSGEQPPYDKNDKIGLLGIEASMESVLRGQKGTREIEVNANQREVREIQNVPPVPGNNVVLTIDSALQISVTKILQNGIALAHAAVGPRGGVATGGGVAIVQKVNTGEILALVSLPSYDNNLFAEGITQQELDQLNNDPNNPMFNRAIGGGYAPGSTFKMITAAAGLQAGVITASTTIWAPGLLSVPLTYNENQRNIYKDWKASGHGALTVRQALEESSDTFFYQVAGPEQRDDLGHLTHFYIPGDPTPHPFFGLGIERLDKWISEFGVGSKTGIDLPGEIGGIVPGPAYKASINTADKWSLGDTLVTAIGQGFNYMTPLQLSNVTATVANGGTLYQPQIVKQVLTSDGDLRAIQDFQPKVIRHVQVDPANLALIREGMRLVVADPHHGTANKTNLKGVAIAGKTGTAEIGDVIDAAGHRRAHAWFTAFAPYENPDIAVTVLIEAGDESLEGSTYAVPVARGIFEAYFHLENEH